MTEEARKLRSEFEQWGVMVDELKLYGMAYSDAMNRYYNGKWDLAWQAFRAGHELGEKAGRSEKWISVSDRLPEMDATLYLTHSAGYPELHAEKNGIDTYTAQGQAIWYNFAKHGFGITHWMSLPVPPSTTTDGG